MNLEVFTLGYFARTPSTLRDTLPYLFQNTSLANTDINVVIIAKIDSMIIFSMILKFQ